jgi:hypothetical protein
VSLPLGNRGKSLTETASGLPQIEAEMDSETRLRTAPDLNELHCDHAKYLQSDTAIWLAGPITVS